MGVQEHNQQSYWWVHFTERRGSSFSQTVKLFVKLIATRFLENKIKQGFKMWLNSLRRSILVAAKSKPVQIFCHRGWTIEHSRESISPCIPIACAPSLVTLRDQNTTRWAPHVMSCRSLQWLWKGAHRSCSVFLGLLPMSQVQAGAGSMSLSGVLVSKQAKPSLHSKQVPPAEDTAGTDMDTAAGQCPWFTFWIYCYIVDLSKRD